MDRNFDDSYVANQIFLNLIVPSSSSNNNQWNDFDNSDRDLRVTTSLTSDVKVGFDSKEKVEEEEEENEVKEDNERLGFLLPGKRTYKITHRQCQ
ncbi:hypothetical protein RYX36_009336 [Vicia faba]